MGALFDGWASRLDVLPVALALALRSTAGAATKAAQPLVELVWTGPNTSETQLRRNNQALLELIHSAQRDLIIVSFAVYDVHDILQAIATAQRRGVRVIMCIELAHRSAGRTARQTLTSSGLGIERGIDIYHWPAEQRQVDNGQPGVLHAKFAVADEHTLFISSANLTGDALAVNIELGVLIHGGTQAGEAQPGQPRRSPHGERGLKHLMHEACMITGAPSPPVSGNNGYSLNASSLKPTRGVIPDEKIQRV